MEAILNHIENFEKHLQSVKVFPENHIQSLYEPCNYFISNAGKRIRPVLCLLAAELFGEIPQDAYNLATGIELFHNFTLLHDDIMDESPLRRGKETVHLKYGDATAILAGDVMMVYAYQHLSNIDPSLLADVFHHFNKMGIEVCEGQQLDMDFEKQEEVKMEDYLEMIKLKTSVLLGTSLQLGAICQKADQDIQDSLYRLGLHLGMSFQLRDDYLDSFGTQEDIGKKPGGDIRSNKKTCLYIEAKKHFDQDTWENMWNIEDEEEKVEVITDVFKELEIDAFMLELINDYANKAQAEIEHLQVLGLDTTNLAALSQYLLNREK